MSFSLRSLMHLIITAAAFLYSETYNYAVAQTARHFIDRGDIDTTIRPGDNFCRYAAGNWLKNNPIPDFASHWGTFEKVSENNEARLHLLLDSVASLTSIAGGSGLQQTVDLYKSGMDSAAIEKAGLKPLKEELERIDNVHSVKELLAEIALEHTEGIPALFSFAVNPDRGNRSKEMCVFTQGGLGMPGKGYYLDEDDRTTAIRKAYQEYIKQMLTLMGDTDNARKDARHIYNLEFTLARTSVNEHEQRAPKVYKVRTERMGEMTPTIDWQKMLTNLKAGGQDSIKIGMIPFFEEVSKQLNVTPLSTWKKYLQYHLVNNMAPHLSDNFANTRFNFYGRTLLGRKVQPPRWKNVLSVAEHTEGDVLGQMFVARYFDTATKQRVTELTQHLLQTYAGRIRRIDWLSDSTKNKALAKLDAMTIKIGSTPKEKDQSTLTVTNNDFVKNIRTTRQWAYDKMVNKLSAPAEKTKWNVSALTVNAFYNYQFNTIAIPAGILQLPIYDTNADDAVIYGCLGAIIAHEITHGFDNEGRYRDADGDNTNWWTNEDANNFNRKAIALTDEYNNIVFADTFRVDGSFTEKDNIADLGGLNIAYEAFKKTKQGQSNELIDGLTPDQRFFISWVQMWRANITPEEFMWRLRNNTHTPDAVRCNLPPSNIDAWYKAFHVQPGDKFFRPIDKRVRIW